MPEPAGKSLFSVMSLSNAKLDLLLKLYVTVTTVKKTLFAKDYLLTLLKSRLALGSPGCLVVRLFVTMPKMAQYTEK